MFTLDYRKSFNKQTYRVYLMGDLHIGRIGVAEKKIQTAIDIINEDRNGYVCLMGDLVESITPSDKRYKPAEQSGKHARITSQCDDVIDMFKPIAHKVLSILIGNHEWKVEETLNTAEYIRDGLGLDIKTGSWTNKVILSDSIKLWLTHGHGSINHKAGDPEQRERNEAIAIKRKLRDLSADCIIMAMGHVHKLRICKPSKRLWIVDGKQTYPETIIDPATGGISEDMRYYCSTGSFVTGYVEGVDTYVERAQYAPTELGMIKCSIQQDKVKDVEKIIL